MSNNNKNKNKNINLPFSANQQKNIRNSMSSIATSSTANSSELASPNTHLLNLIANQNKELEQFKQKMEEKEQIENMLNEQLDDLKFQVDLNKAVVESTVSERYENQIRELHLFIKEILEANKDTGNIADQAAVDIKGNRISSMSKKSKSKNEKLDKENISKVVSLTISEIKHIFNKLITEHMAKHEIKGLLNRLVIDIDEIEDQQQSIESNIFKKLKINK